MAIDIRKISNGVSSSRSVYQHKHFCIRALHLLLGHPLNTCLLLFAIYLQIMDVILYFKIRSRESLDTNKTINNHTTIDIFESLPIKKIMVGHIVS